ncbi:MAG: hypothetical protein ABS40_21210 [Agrobacterium sp. SCN 61-19]|nr:MAG: hypothetical protein ABS40_21210 [Agrobacterium sp. SCN 61-19]
MAKVSVIPRINTSEWIVYTLSDSRSRDEIRYVGITKNPDARLSQHKGDKGRSHKACWVRSVLRDGGSLVMKAIEAGLTWEQATSREVAIIADFRSRGVRLTNSTDGGEGIPGHEASDELREVRARNATGRVHSPETKMKMSAWQVGQKRPERGPAIAEAKRMSPPAPGTFKGVYPRGSRWTANIYLNGKQKYLGAFGYPEDAARAYDAAAFDAWGSKVWLNYPVNDNRLLAA